MGRKTKSEIKDEAVRAALTEQLKARKADTPFFIDQVDEIIFCRVQLRALKKIIADNGIIRVTQNKNGTSKASITPVLKEIRETEKHIMRILKALRITTDNIIPDSDDDEL